MIRRSSGILMHITSLPSPYGIGTFGKEAYDFVDFLAKGGQSYWQILPLSSTGYGDSPYQSFSAFAGNPYLIDFLLLTEEGLLKLEDYENLDFGNNSSEVDYEKIFKNKMLVLGIAYERSIGKYKYELDVFREENKDWLEEYGLYMAIKLKFGLKSWQQWDENIRLRNKYVLARYKKELKKEIDYWIFIQYLFFSQWKALKNYAHSKGIKIIGDIPIYVAEDSADVWSNSEIFKLDENGKPIVVSGCPPDFFSKTGQLWGNPIYRWDILEERNFKWWIKRIEKSINLYDVIRIDHFRGFESYWEIPYGDETAINGRWVKGPGIKLFNSIKEALGEINIIAEDLGYLTQEVVEFKNATGYPGMKVLEFAFDSREESDYLPHNYNKNCVVYIGTHDNDTANGWMRNAKKRDVDFATKYLKLSTEEGYNWGFIRGALSSVGNLAIVQMQDYLGIGSEGRMNTPSTLEKNWKWRINKEYITEELCEKIFEITRLYGRLRKEF